jgi:hypothetical protein
MGEHRRKLSPVPPAANQAIISDVDEAGKILALEKTYCDQCGQEFPLWPPELLNEHLHGEHAGMFWPTTTEEWETYKADQDLARRANYVTAYRVRFLFLVLQNRCDLYTKLVGAGVIAAPAKG